MAEADFTSEMSSRLDLCEQRLGYAFADRSLLHAALTHASSAQHRLASNERMEFLGDAILGAVVCERLYHQFPERLEGNLTKIKSVVVSRKTCAMISRELGLDELLIVGRGISETQTVPRSLLADVFESLVAAIYLDRGYQAARDFIVRHVDVHIERAADQTRDENYKSLLQQVVQRDYGVMPTYELLEQAGPDHSKQFKVAALFDQQQWPPAWGRNKKEAERRAAANALARLDGDPLPYPAQDDPHD